MQTYETYLKERKSLEALSKEDKNITNSLNRQTTSRIQTNEELQEQGIIQDVFNIDFMDKTSLKQLQEMLTKYQISKSLQERQVFVNPNEIEPQEENEEKPKRLKRDPRR
jgi:ATP-dependent Lon protease